MRLNKKIDINIGYTCNVECKFCYYHPLLKTKFFDPGIIRRQLRAAKMLGVEEIDFTGGEPTMSRDLIPLVASARSLGFKKICLISNGILLADIGYFRTLKDTGVEDVLFSIHGDDAALHDDIMGRAGSFDKCMRAIENAKSLGVRVRTNSVITTYNYRRLDRIARLILGIVPQVASFIHMNPCACREIYTRDIVPMLKETVPYAKEAVDILRRAAKVNIMYIPFCLMAGYERYLHNMHQVHYDPEEWDYLARSMVQNGSLRTLGFAIHRGIPHLSSKDILTLPVSELLHRAMIEALCRKHNVMPPGCRQCRYVLVCDGPWRGYLDLYGPGEFQPVGGARVRDPSFFMREEYRAENG